MKAFEDQSRSISGIQQSMVRAGRGTERVALEEQSIDKTEEATNIVFGVQRHL